VVSKCCNLKPKCWHLLHMKYMQGHNICSLHSVAETLCATGYIYVMEIMSLMFVLLHFVCEQCLTASGTVNIMLCLMAGAVPGLKSVYVADTCTWVKRTEVAEMRPCSTIRNQTITEELKVFWCCNKAVAGRMNWYHYFESLFDVTLY
jgi:hypothetical protein